MRTKKDEIAIVRSQRSWIDFSGRLTDVQSKVNKIENSVIALNVKIDKIENNAAVVFFVASILFIIRSEVKDDKMRKEMDKNKAEADAKVDKNKAEADKNKAEADAKMDRNFIITNSISATSLLVSLVMTLAAKK